MPTLKVIVGPDSFQEHAPRQWREGLATDPIFMDVTAEVLQGSRSYLLLEVMDGISFSIFSAGRYGKGISCFMSWWVPLSFCEHLGFQALVPKI